MAGSLEYEGVKNTTGVDEQVARPGRLKSRARNPAPVSFLFVDSEGGWGGGIVIVLDDIGEDEIPAPDHLAHVVAPPSSVGAVVSAAWELLNERRQRLRPVCRNPRSRGVALLSAAGA